MLTIASRLDVMNRLGRAMADPTRSRILMSLLDSPSHPAVLSRELGLTRSNVSNHLTCLRARGVGGAADVLTGTVPFGSTTLDGAGEGRVPVPPYAAWWLVRPTD